MEAEGETTPGGVVMTSDPGMPRWFFWLLLFVCPLLILAGDDALAQYAILGILWTVFFSCYGNTPERTLLVFIILLPVTQLMTADFRLLPGLNFHTFAVAALVVAVYMRPNRQEPIPRNGITAPVVFFAIVVSLSTVVSYWTGNAQYHEWNVGWTRYTAYELFSSWKNVVLFVFLTPIAFRLLWRPKFLASASQLIACSGLLVCGHALWNFRGVITSGLAGPAHRIPGFFAQANLMGAFAALMVCLFFPLALGARSGWIERALYVGTVAVGGVTLLLSFSRGSWLAAMAGLFVLGLARGVKMVAVLIALALTATAWLPQEVFERAQYTFKERRSFQDTETELEPSAQVRLSQWSSLPRLLLEAPVLGHGYNSFKKTYGEITESGVARSAHSSIVKLTVEQGVAGFVAYFWLIGVLTWQAWKLSRRSQDPWIASLAGGLVAGMICLVVLDGSGNRFYDFRLTAYLWILGGGVARVRSDLAQRDDDPVAATAPRPAIRRAGRPVHAC